MVIRQRKVRTVFAHLQPRQTWAIAKGDSFGGIAPPQILTYRAGAFTDTTREFTDELREHVAQLEQQEFNGRNFAGVPNGILADYVASKAMLGEFEEAWAFMLENYDPQSDWKLEIRDETGEIVGYYPDYPTALRAFLAERGYL